MMGKNCGAKLKAVAIKRELIESDGFAPTTSTVKPKKRTTSRVKTEESNISTDDTSSTSDEITLDLLRQHHFTTAAAGNAQPSKASKKVKVKMEQSSDGEQKKKCGRKAATKTTPTVAKKKTVVRGKPKLLMIKKRVLAAGKEKLKDEQRMRRMKLFGFWTGPKRHRVASLNALAKVHCLYENETRGALLDSMEQPMMKVEPVAKVSKEEPKEEPVKRNLRSAPGMRGAGKHWDMNDTTSSSSSSSEDNSSNDCVDDRRPSKLLVPPPSYKQKVAAEKQEAKKPEVVKRRRNRTEIIMDLKDMVVRKRMASLNASAILAASYSVEKRNVRSPKTEDSDESENSSDVSYKEEPKKKCYEADVIKTEDEVNKVKATTPNKKVAVILNQDTDVTITGVYVNSTTRSTHHEGYCSIAGMQYRISATSHTQTAATAVATETLLHHSAGANPEHVSVMSFFFLVLPLGESVLCLLRLLTLFDRGFKT